MSYYKSIITAKKDSDVNDFGEGVARELFKLCYAFFKDNAEAVCAMKYVVLAYDKDSPLNTLTDRKEIREKAKTQSGIADSEQKSILRNENVEFNKIINYYLKSTQPQAHNTLVTGKEILAEHLAVCREQISFKESGLTYEEYLRAMKNKAELFLKTLEIQNSLRDLETKVNLDDKNIH